MECVGEGQCAKKRDGYLYRKHDVPFTPACFQMSRMIAPVLIGFL